MERIYKIGKLHIGGNGEKSHGQQYLVSNHNELYLNDSLNHDHFLFS